MANTCCFKKKKKSCENYGSIRLDLQLDWPEPLFNPLKITCFNLQPVWPTTRLTRLKLDSTRSFCHVYLKPSYFSLQSLCVCVCVCVCVWHHHRSLHSHSLMDYLHTIRTLPLHLHWAHCTLWPGQWRHSSSGDTTAWCVFFFFVSGITMGGEEGFWWD